MDELYPSLVQLIRLCTHNTNNKHCVDSQFIIANVYKFPKDIIFRVKLSFAVYLHTHLCMNCMQQISTYT